MRVSGQIIEVLPKKSGTSNKGITWESQDFVVQYKETPGQFGFDTMVANLFGTSVIAHHDLHVGDMVDMYVEFKADEYNGRWYNHVKVIQLKKIEGKEGAVEEPETQTATETKPESPTAEEQAMENDLPF